MKAFIIYGLSGSGKTTKAKALIEEGNTTDLVWFDYGAHVERDKIRFEELKLGDWATYRFNTETEHLVDAIWRCQIGRLSRSGSDIVISDTLCKLSDRKKLVKFLTKLGYESVNLIQMETSLEDCIVRDKQRGAMSVGEDVIRKQYENLMKG